MGGKVLIINYYHQPLGVKL